MKPADLARYLSAGTPESSKRLIAYQASRVLMGCQIALTTLVFWQGFISHTIDGGLLTAWTFGGGVLAALAQQIYKKPDGASNV